jgi:hypothetical protein
MTGRPKRGIAVIDSPVLDDKELDRWIGSQPGERYRQGGYTVLAAPAAPYASPRSRRSSRNSLIAWS